MAKSSKRQKHQKKVRATARPPEPSAAFDAIVAALTRGDPTVEPPSTSGRAFGSNALKVRGKIFAMVVKGGLVVKLPRDRVDALVGSGVGMRFDPGHGRLMKEWLSVQGSKGDWLALAREARAFVDPGGR